MRPSNLSRLFVMGTLLVMMLVGALCVALLCFFIAAIVFDSYPICLIAAVVGFAWSLIFGFLAADLEQEGETP